MVSKNEALQKIEEISQAMRQSSVVFLPGALLIFIGFGVMSIPLLELFLWPFVDQFLQEWNLSLAVIFLMRTVVYWVVFALLSRSFVCREEIVHPIIKSAWAFNQFFPLVPVATAGMLAYIGYKILVMPIVLVLIGCYFVLIGRFTHGAVTGLALSYLTVGIGSIYLTTYNISALWAYLLIFQGLASVVVGLIINYDCHE